MTDQRRTHILDPATGAPPNQAAGTHSQGVQTLTYCGLLAIEVKSWVVDHHADSDRFNPQFPLCETCTAERKAPNAPTAVQA